MTLGEKLRKLRSDKRISLGEVSKATKIQVGYLECLEEGNYDKLPADVYTKGFLRSYADFLGVDETILIRLYDKEKGIKRNLEKDFKPKTEKIKPINISSFVFTPQKIVAVAVVVVVILGLFFLYREVDSFASAPNLLILSPDNNSEVKGNSVYVKGSTDKEAALFINGQPILVGDDGKFGENLTLQSGLNNITVRAVNKFKKEISETVVVRADYPTENAGASADTSGAEVSGSDVASQEQGVQLDLRVDPGPVWLNVETDGSSAFSGTMLSGTVQSFTAKEKIVISSGNGKATFIKLNGQEVGALSTDAGAVREVTFTKNTKSASGDNLNTNEAVDAPVVADPPKKTDKKK